MPTYDYECQACGHAFERWQEMSARKLRTCPECRKRRLVRLVGAGAGVIFRGSGFYETDYKRSSSSSKPPANGEAKSETPAKAETASKGDASASASASRSKDGAKE